MSCRLYEPTPPENRDLLWAVRSASNRGGPSILFPDQVTLPLPGNHQAKKSFFLCGAIVGGLPTEKKTSAPLRLVFLR